ncbi:uncharacterized protein LOC118291640 [Scophthalmus maximus]|uniref:Uncharacterized protein n=1 Tax=Scophthalmus maximus TaxID=52904 RepID=A0A8D3BLY1_SCOMX|nr:uncharacterized protein LOC118291640 [Scophthalmus maximus]
MLFQMTPSLRRGASQLTLLFLTLLCSLPWTACSCPLSHAAASEDGSNDPRDDGLVRPEARAGRHLDPLRALLEPGRGAGEALPRAQRGDLTARPLSPFPGSHSLESSHYQYGGEGEDGGKRNDALTSIAGGLQAVNREKGGFGFRFGRKRWTDRGWRDEGRGGTQGDK